MVFAVSWLALLMLGSGTAVLALLRYFWAYRDEPGGRWWIAVLVCMAIYSLSYGAGLLVFDPGIRWLFDVPRFLAAGWAGVGFLGFALAYTGRDQYRDWDAFRGLVAFEAVSAVLLVTNPFHHLFWRDYHLDPTFGAATVSFARGPLLFLLIGVTWLSIGVGVVLLFDAIISYGPLYRSQALAIAITPIPVAVASLAWLFELGPFPHVDFTSLAFVPHLALDIYALFWGGMFDLTPAARRLGERAALDDLGIAVASVDEDGRVVGLNEAAGELLDVPRRVALGQPLDALLGDEVNLEREEQAITVRTEGERRELAVTTSSVEDASGTAVGHTVVFHDVTEARQRKQRLEVLNRVLRHNLRNDLTVINGFAETIPEVCDDSQVETAAEKIVQKGERLTDLGEKAHRISTILDDANDEQEVTVRDLLDGLEVDFETRYPGGTVTVECPRDVRLHTNPDVLAAVFENLLENAFEHHDGGHPQVEVELVDASGHSAAFEVRDDGAGIPEYEREVLLRGEEDPLEHGSGLGLWLVKWGITSLGGECSFDVDDDGTTVELRVPGLVDRPSN